MGLNAVVGVTDAGGGGGARACGGGVVAGCCDCIGDGTIMPGIIGGACCCGDVIGADGAPYPTLGCGDTPCEATGGGSGAPMLPAATCAATLYAAVIVGGTAVLVGCPTPPAP